MNEMKLTEENKNLMFSCCERKLLTEVYDKKVKNLTIYVSRNVCQKCRMAINHLERAQGCRIQVKIPLADKNDIHNHRELIKLATDIAEANKVCEKL